MNTVGARGCLVLLAAIGGALALGLVAPRAAGSAPSFAAAKAYATDEGFDSILAVDLNGDKRPDLAMANGYGDALSVLLNRGGGKFPRRRDYPTEDSPEMVAAGDLNGDRKPDLAVTTDDGTIAVFMNKGDGTFRPRREYRTGYLALSLAIADLNGDGKADLAAVNTFVSTVSVLLNTGDGTLGPRVPYETGHRPGSIAIADVNGDHKRDLVTSNGPSRTVSVLLNAGNGSFERKRDYPASKFSGSIAIGDLNGDGRPDLATGNYGDDTISVLVNTGGRFGPRRDYGTGDGPTSVAIGDLTGDGRPDLASANNLGESTRELLGHTVSVLANKGGGSFRSRLDYRTGIGIWWVAIADLNGDGKRDLATANGEDGVSVLINTPGLCDVQDVLGTTLAAARQTLVRANCRTGTIRYASSKRVKRGRVITQKPRFGAVLPKGARIDLALSLGRKR